MLNDLGGDNWAVHRLLCGRDGDASADCHDGAERLGNLQHSTVSPRPTVSQQAISQSCGNDGASCRIHLKTKHVGETAKLFVE